MDFRVDSPRHGGYLPFLDPPDPLADQADIRRGWADSPIIFSLQSSQSPGRYYCAWLPCAPFCYIYIITMRAGSQTKRQRRNKRTSPTSSDNNSTESEREMEEVGTPSIPKQLHGFRSDPALANSRPSNRSAQF